MKLKLLTSVLFCFVLTVGLTAQEAITASGGESSGAGGTTSYSIGQIVYTTYTGTNGNSVSQGVIQPFDISVQSAIPGTEEINLEMLAYPNPTSDFIVLKLGDISDMQYEAYLFNINGEQIIKIKITESETQIAMQNLNPSIYFLKVSSNEKEIKVFKIIKR